MLETVKLTSMMLVMLVCVILARVRNRMSQTCAMSLEYLKNRLQCRSMPMPVKNIEKRVCTSVLA